MSVNSNISKFRESKQKFVGIITKDGIVVEILLIIRNMIFTSDISNESQIQLFVISKLYVSYVKGNK